MGLETGTYISDLNADNATPGDPKSQGDDHLRLIKKVLKNCFPLFAGALPIAHDQVASKTDVTQAAFKAALPAQAGNVGRYATTDGATASWGVIPGDAVYLYRTFGGL